MGLLDLLFKKVRSKKITFTEGFNLLLQRFDLVDKAEMRAFWHFPQHTFTLFRIVGEGEDRSIPLPMNFVLKVKELAFRFYGGGSSQEFAFEIGPAKTKAEIEKFQRDWSAYCEQYNGDS